MSLLGHSPALGHITTFGGNAVIASAALATLKEITESQLIPQTLIKENLFRKLLDHPLIKEIRGKGLMLILLMESSEIATEVILKCKDRGLILFWLLFEPRAVRITPPLTVSEDEIKEGCAILTDVLHAVAQSQAS
jgi:acetylornithine aminotransferase